MTALLDNVRREVEELHVFFTEWFHGTADRSQLEARFISHLHPDMIVIPPEGVVLKPADLQASFEKAFGSNPDFRIQIRDVEVRIQSDDLVLVTYTEWQTGARRSASANNARISTALMQLGDPILWLHLQETWLPEEIRAADPFEF